MAINGLTVTPSSIIMIVDGDTKVLTVESHRKYDEIREAIKASDLDEAERLVNLAAELEKQFSKTGGRVRIVHGLLYLDSLPLHTALANRIVQMANEGFKIDSMCRFLENLYDNPSKRAVDQLFGFLEATDLPITEDGHFLAYKMVRSDYTDHRTGKMDNSIGAVVEMTRNMVDEDPNRTCSAGLHFCSQGYLGMYGGSGRTVILKINPRDVVAIPVDYNNSKGRACRYEIFGELNADKFTSKDTGGYHHSFGKPVVDRQTARGDATHTKSGGLTVRICNDPSLLKNGDILFKNDAATALGLPADVIVELINDEEIDYEINEHGTYLVIWDKSYVSMIPDWKVEYGLSKVRGRSVPRYDDSDWS